MLNPELQIANLRNKCINCGKCRKVCPTYEDGMDPTEIMVGGESDLSACRMCGACSSVCRRSDPFTVIRLMKENGLE